MCEADDAKGLLKDVSLEVENFQESVPDLRLLYRKIERKALIRRVLGAVTGSSILNKFRQSSIRKEHVRFKYFVGISAKKEKIKKEKCCSEESLQNI